MILISKMTALIFALSLLACSDDNVSFRGKSIKKGAAEEIEVSQIDANSEAAKKKSSSGDSGENGQGNLTTKQKESIQRCAEHAGVTAPQVLVYGDKSEISISETSVLIVFVTGNANFSFENISAPSIAGLCLATQGSSHLGVSAHFDIDALFVESGGNSSVQIDFDDGFQVSSQIEVEFKGKPTLEINGSSVDCDAIMANAGNRGVSCGP